MEFLLALRKGAYALESEGSLNRVEKAFCVYCGLPANTRDHVPPKCLLEKPYPANLRWVPSCEKCNTGFSLDEQYFLILLGQIGLTNALLQKTEMGGVIDRTLERAPKLDERLIASLETDEDGRILVRPEIARVNRVIQKVGLGCFILRYGRIPRLEKLVPVAAYPYAMREERPAPLFVATFTERFRSKRWNHVQRGVFSYIIVRDPMTSRRLWCVMDFYETLWGVVHFPNPKSVQARQDRQLWLLWKRD